MWLEGSIFLELCPTHAKSSWKYTTSLQQKDLVYFKNILMQFEWRCNIFNPRPLTATCIQHPQVVPSLWGSAAPETAPGKPNCEYVPLLSRCTSSLVRLYNIKPTLEWSKPTREGLVYNFTESFWKRKRKKNNLTFNLELNTNRIQAQRQLGAYLFWHCASGIFLIHSKHPTQCSAIIHTHLCISRTGLCAVVSLF